MGRGFFSVIRVLLLAALLAGSGSALAAQTILVYGDSLAAGYGLAADAGWVTKLGERLKQLRSDYTVVNASISGETSAGGASRIGRVLEETRPAVMVLELGANDGLRGLPVDRMKANLSAIIRAARAKRVRVLLVGMRLPPNYGPPYTESFQRAFAEVAREEHVPLVPFLLAGIAEDRGMFQEDNLHPTAQAQHVLLDNVWQKLEPMLRQSAARSAATAYPIGLRRR